MLLCTAGGAGAWKVGAAAAAGEAQIRETLLETLHLLAATGMLLCTAGAWQMGAAAAAGGAWHGCARADQADQGRAAGGARGGAQGGRPAARRQRARLYIPSIMCIIQMLDFSVHDTFLFLSLGRCSRLSARRPACSPPPACASYMRLPDMRLAGWQCGVLRPASVLSLSLHIAESSARIAPQPCSRHKQICGANSQFTCT